MKNIRRILIIVLVLVTFIAGAIVWWNYPSPITDIAPSEVTSILFIEYDKGGAKHGGTRITVTDQMDIKHIMENFNSVSLKKEKLSLDYPVLGLGITILEIDGSTHRFVIDSNSPNSRIRKGLLFYRPESGSIDLSYIQEMFSKYPHSFIIP